MQTIPLGPFQSIQESHQFVLAGQQRWYSHHAQSHGLQQSQGVGTSAIAVQPLRVLHGIRAPLPQFRTGSRCVLEE